MSRRKKNKIEFRYCKMPPDSLILALLREKWPLDYGRDTDTLHFHNYLEIGRCCEGEGVLILGEEEYPFEKGCFTVIPGNFPHATNNAPGVASQWEYLFVDADALLQNFSQGGRQKKAERMLQRIQAGALFLTEREDPRLAGMIRNVFDIMREAKEYYLEEAEGSMAAVLAETARKNKNDGGIPEELGDESAVSIAHVLDHISVHYMEPLKIADLADFCHISETHFRRIFTACMNMGPLEYVNLVRVQIACDLLRKTEEPIGNIAHRCGFATLSTFNRNFRQVTGVSPREWRSRPGCYGRKIIKSEVCPQEEEEKKSC